MVLRITPVSAVAAGAALLLACLDSPQFQLSEADTAASAQTDGTMVRVPAAVIGGGAVSTQDKGGNPGGGPGKKDAGAPPTPGDPPSPAGTVVNSFWLDAHEVTNQQYNACVTAGGCTASACAVADDDHPVGCIALDQATAYCTYMNKRLPSEDEFTSAAAGSANRTYPWGTEAPATDRLNMAGVDLYVGTAPVGSFPKGATPDGVLDLAGNVAELVSSGRARGGSYEDSDSAAVQSSAGITPSGAVPTVGFRCARD